MSKYPRVRVCEFVLAKGTILHAVHGMSISVSKSVPRVLKWYSPVDKVKQALIKVTVKPS